MDAYSVVCHLREHYNEQVITERFKASNMLFSSKMEAGASLIQYALKMYEYIERLNQLGHWMDFELIMDLILTSSPDSFAQFVLGYKMNNIMSTIPKLISTLKIYEGRMAEKKARETKPNGTFFHHGKDGHWKRNCKAYMESRKKVACDVPST